MWASKTSGMFLRGRFGADHVSISHRSCPSTQTLLDQALGPNQSTSGGHYYSTWQDIAVQQESRWDELIDWMEAQRQRYSEVLRTIEESEADGTL